MKIISVVVFILAQFTFSALAHKHQGWICEVRDPSWPWPKKSQVIASLQDPQVERIDWILDDDGTYSEQREHLMTTATVSTWKEQIANCQIQAGFKENSSVDAYEYSFVCKGLEGSFRLDFRTRTGFYSQRLTSFHTSRSFGLENCLPLE